MMKNIFVVLVVMTASACAPQHEPTVNGDIYLGSGGPHARVGVSTGNFGISVGR